SDLGLSKLKIYRSEIPIHVLSFIISQASYRLTLLDVRINGIQSHEIIHLLETISQNCKNLIEFSTYIIPSHNLLPLLLPILSSNSKLEILIIDADDLSSEDVDTFLP